MTNAKNNEVDAGDIRRALKSNVAAFIGIGLLSAIINVLYLTASFFMLEVYDRVIPSHSVPTLIGLGIIALALYAFQGAFDVIRGRVLLRIGASVDESLRGQAFDALVRLPLLAGSRAEAAQPVRHLDQVRAFLSSTGPAAFFDLPWLPLYLAICYLFHPVIGLTATIGAALLVGIALLTEFAVRGPNKASLLLGMRRQAFAETSRRNAEVLGAMGMEARMAARWQELNAPYLSAQVKAGDVVTGLGTLTRVLRTTLQSGVLAVGAYLVINQEATAGIIIASSILTSRSLAPVEQAIANWRGFLAARESWKRLRELFTLLPAPAARLDLARPVERLVAERVSANPPGAEKLVVQDVSLELRAGQALAVIGPSGSGKSSLARVLVGLWRPQRGKVRLDGAALEQLPAAALGADIGYLPQTVELLVGSVGENIARFDPSAKAEAIVAAAKAAGVHDMILRLPDGYETQVGEDGSALSSGQRQRIALARALYGDPFLVVLDEPNSNLDADGEAALAEALFAVRRRGGIAVVVAHRSSVLVATDLVLAMAEGRMAAFGPRDEVMSRIARRPSAPTPTPLKVVGETPVSS